MLSRFLCSARRSLSGATNGSLRGLATSSDSGSNSSCDAGFLGAKTTFTNKLDFTNYDENTAGIPCYQLMDYEGQIITPEHDPKLSQDTLVRMYETMLTLQVMDNVLYDAQRQGRISFYMTSYGEEATHIGSAAALKPADVVWAQYREAGVLLWRGFTVQDAMNQCYSNMHDRGKGRQMPVHYGSRALNFHTISSPLGTQLPQAVGGAYALKLSTRDAIGVTYFGEGAASEGDFHAAMNFAATLEAPVMFFCRNNGYAISTPTRDQYRGDGIAGRGPGYGVATIRVDGNDVLGVYRVVQHAREHIRQTGRPVLVEAMTYRGGHHSTSDDASRYRSVDETQFWLQERNPLRRFARYLGARGCWSDAQELAARDALRTRVLEALRDAERAPKPHIANLFTDVYHTLPPHLQAQQQAMHQHLAEYGDKYPLDQYAKA